MSHLILTRKTPLTRICRYITVGNWAPFGDCTSSHSHNVFFCLHGARSYMLVLVQYLIASALDVIIAELTVLYA